MKNANRHNICQKNGSEEWKIEEVMPIIELMNKGIEKKN